MLLKVMNINLKKEVNMKRERFVPNSPSQVHQTKDHVIYEYEENGGLYAVGYKGKKAKPSFYYKFASESQRRSNIDEKLGWYKKEEGYEVERKLKQAKEYTEFTKQLRLGTVLTYSWGHDQTNIEFYEVVGFKGKATVKLRKIEEECSPEDGFMTATKTAKPGQYKGEAFEKRINPKYGACLKMDYGIAQIWDGKPERYSWYA